MAKDGPTQAEVDAAIANIAGGYGLRFQSAADIGAALRRRRAPRLRRRVPDELPDRGRQGRRRRGEARGGRDPRSEGLRDRDGRRREGSRAAAQEGGLALREGLVHRSDHAGARGSPSRRRSMPKALAAAHQLLDRGARREGRQGEARRDQGAAHGRDRHDRRSRARPCRSRSSACSSLPDKMRIDATLDEAGQGRRSRRRQGRLAAAARPADGNAADRRAQGAEDIGRVEFERWREPELHLAQGDRSGREDHAGAGRDDRRQAARAWSGSRRRSGPRRHALHRQEDQAGHADQLTTRQAAASQTDDFSDYRDVAGHQGRVQAHEHGSGPRRPQLELTKVELGHRRSIRRSSRSRQIAQSETLVALALSSLVGALAARAHAQPRHARSRRARRDGRRRTRRR